MSRLEELIAELCPNGVEYKTLGEIGTFTRGNGLQKKDFTASGVGCIHYGEIYTFYKNYAYETKSFVTKELADKLKKATYGDLIFAITSENVEDVCKCLAWLGDTDIAIGGHSAVFNHNQNPKYIAYCTQTKNFFNQKRKIITGTKVIEASPAKLALIKIPVPPLSVQEEIVRILDTFSELNAELNAELTKRKQQYQYYRNNLLDFSESRNVKSKKLEKLISALCPNGIEYKLLGELGRIAMCKRILKHETASEGDVPFYKIGTFGKEADAYISYEKYIEYKTKYSFPVKGDVLISAAGTIGRTVIYNGEDAYYQDSNIVWLEHDRKYILNKYLFYFYQLNPWNISFGGTIARLYNENITKVRIPVPPLPIQEEIVRLLDRFDALCNDLTSGLPAEIEARKRQYEYYRDKLLTFKESV